MWGTRRTISHHVGKSCSDPNREGNWTLCLWDTSPTGQFAYCLVISPTGYFAYKTFRLLPGQFAYRYYTSEFILLWQSCW